MTAAAARTSRTIRPAAERLAGDTRDTCSLIDPFIYTAHPARVIFGPGTLRQLPAEVERLGLRRVLVVSSLQQETEACATVEAIGGRAVAVFAGAAMHTPVAVTEKATALVLAERFDGVVAVGGGSTTGLAKATALRTDLPQIVAPTTYAGSEMTPILGETRDGVTTTQKSPKILPEVVIDDVDLTLSLPVALSSVSGMNAIAHAVEALYAQDRNPIISLMAVEGIRALAHALPKIAEDPTDREARSDVLYPETRRQPLTAPSAEASPLPPELKPYGGRGRSDRTLLPPREKVARSGIRGSAAPRPPRPSRACGAIHLLPRGETKIRGVSRDVYARSPLRVKVARDGPLTPAG